MYRFVHFTACGLYHQLLYICNDVIIQTHWSKIAWPVAWPVGKQRCTDYLCGCIKPSITLSFTRLRLSLLLCASLKRVSHSLLITPFIMIGCYHWHKKLTLQKLHNSKLWYRPLNHKQEQNRRGWWQGRTCKTTTNNNVEKEWSKSGRYLSAYMSINMLNMSDNKPTICRTECLVVHHVRYHVRYLTPKRHPENEIIIIRKMHFIPLKVSFHVWKDTQRILDFQFGLKMDIMDLKGLKKKRIQ